MVLEFAMYQELFSHGHSRVSSSCVLYDMHKLYLYNYPKSNFNSHLTFVGSYFSIATARFRRLSIASGIFSTINDSAFTPDFDLLFIDSFVMYIHKSSSRVF